MSAGPEDMQQPAVPDGEYPVGRPDPEVEPDSNIYPSDPNRIPNLLSPRPEPFQLSIAELLVSTGLVAFVLGILVVFPRQYAAGLAGLGVLISLLVIIVLQPTRPVVITTWWALFLVYLALSFLAMASS